MKRFLIGVLFVGVLGTIAGIVAPANASAATVTGYGRGWVGSTGYTITTRAQANSFLAALCGWSGYGKPVAVVGYPTDMTMNEANGRMSYTANVVWRSCANDNSTRSFAITGYPDSEPGSLATCPNAGRYHDGYAITYDCIKYTMSDGGHMTGYSRLRCPWGINYACVNGGSSPSGVFRSIVERIEKYPPTSPQLSRLSMGGTVPNWSTETLTSGSYPFNRAAAFCTFFKYNSNGTSSGANCTALYINVSWVRANYELRPAITAPANGTVIASNSGPVTARGTVTRVGSTSSNPARWQMTQLVYAPSMALSSIPGRAGASSASDPCAFFTSEASCSSIGSGTGVTYSGSSTSHTAPSTIGTYSVGTKICYALSVKDRRHDDSRWQHSALACYIIGKSPKVAVIGGDLFVGRLPAGASSSISTRVVTSQSVNPAGTYGSWVEYAIASRGPVTGMASGSGSVGGSTAWTNLLTFANTGNTSARCSTPNGCYTLGSSLPAIASRFRVNSSTPVMPSGALTSRATGVYRSTTPLTISTSNIPSGKWIVINAENTDVTISGNIQYTNGTLVGVGQVPQVVIIANNITINENVTRVDAWLIAPGRVAANGTVSGGVIRTCNRQSSTISTGTCNQVLTVNGPVVANRLLMLRTGGAGTGAAAGDPAEIFNLRPDAYIWAAQQAQSGGRVTTVSTKELPPRY